jgi:tetratricopeptide (TPR) repeat protein
MPLQRFRWCVPLLAAVAAYAIAPWGALVWDDQLVARQQMAVLHSLREVFLPPPGIPQWTYAYYRPVVVLSYLLDQALFGRGAAAGPHVTNVICHLLATLAVWLLARRLLRRLATGDIAALVAATLFAVHPIHTEAVSWVTGRSDALATMLLLPALLLLLRWVDTGSRLGFALAPVAFLLACLSKEIALSGLLLGPAVVLAARAAGTIPAARRIALRSWLGAAAAWLGAAVLYLALRQAAGTQGAALDAASAADLVARLLRASGYYLGKLAWPWPHAHFVAWDMVPALFPAVTVTGVALLVTILAWRRRDLPRGAGVLLGMAWTLIALAPALAVAATSVAVTPVAERYLYLPSVGLALMGGVAYDAVAARLRPLVAGVLAASLVLAGIAATLVRGQVWQSDLRLWSDAVARTQCCATLFIEYGKAQFQAGNLREAEDSFRRAARLAAAPRQSATAAYNLGVITVMGGDLPGGEALFQQAIRTDASYALPYYGVGRVHYERGLRALRAGDVPRARGLFEQALAQHAVALRLNPAHASAHLETARVLASLGELDAADAGARYQAAREHIEAAARLEPAALARPEVQELAARVANRLRRPAP